MTHKLARSILTFIVFVFFVISCVRYQTDEFLQDRPPLWWMVSYANNKILKLEFTDEDWQVVREHISRNAISTYEDLAYYNYITFKYIKDANDEWLTPSEFYRRGGGDCEDWGIFVYACLIKMGIKDVFLVYTVDKNIETGHVFTAFVVDNSIYIFTPYRFVPYSFLKMSEAVDEIAKRFKRDYYYFYSIRF